MCVFRWQWGQERALTRPELNVVPARCEPHYGSWKPNTGPLDVYYTLSHISSLRNNFNNPYFRCLFFKKKDIVPHKLDWYQTHYAATGWSWTSEPLTSIFHVQGSPPASSEQNWCAFLDSYCVSAGVGHKDRKSSKEMGVHSATGNTQCTAVTRKTANERAVLWLEDKCLRSIMAGSSSWNVYLIWCHGWLFPPRRGGVLSYNNC